MLDERYKVKYGPLLERLGTQRVLLPLSYGASSLALFDMIASLLKEQKLAHKGKQGFELVVCHVLGPGGSRAPQFAKLSAAYSPLEATYTEVSLDDLEIGGRAEITVGPDFSVRGTPSSSQEPVASLLRKAVNRSAEADLAAALLAELIKDVAVQHGCQTVIYGHSMTRLANEVISLTVKGRGLSIHEAVADHDLVHHGRPLRLVFPLREILFAETDAVVRLSDHLAEYLDTSTTAPAAARNRTVEDLTTQYFNNLDATGYASTASTVVKTAEKLRAPQPTVDSVCDFCAGPVYSDPHTWLRNITTTTPAPLLTETERQYAEEYPEGPDRDSGRAMTACYGCTVSLAGAGPGFVWPTRATKEEVLAEYTLE